MTGVEFCWSLDSRGQFCGGRLDWQKTERGYTAECPKCRVERRAASGEQRELEARGEP